MQGVPEGNPLAEIFSEEYSFGARIYNIENSPGVAPTTPGAITEAPTEFPMAETEPTPAALVPGNPGANEAWFAWTGVSPIQISIPSGADVRSIYIVGNFDGFYITVSAGFTVGGVMTVSPGFVKDMVPIPPGSPLLTLSTPTKFTGTVYVCAYGDVWNPFDLSGSGGAGSLVWIQPQPAPLGSGQVYTNVSKYIQLITVGGVGAVAYKNGVILSGGQPATYEVDPGQTLELVYGLDVSIITMTNIVHYYAMSQLNTSNYTTPDSLAPSATGGFYSLEPGHYLAPFLWTSLTSDNAPSIQMNAPGTTADDYGWNCTMGGALVGNQSWVFFFEDLGQNVKSENNGFGFLFLLLSTHANPAPCIQCVWTPGLGAPISGYSMIDHAGLGTTPVALPFPGSGPHLCTITWNDSTATMTVQWDNNSPTSITYEGWTSGFQAYAPHFGADDNGKFTTHIAISKASQWDTVLASTVVTEIYEQATNSVNPVYQWYEVV
jgi:hypothetical protein